MRTLVPILVFAALLLAGCSGSGGSGASTPQLPNLVPRSGSIAFTADSVQAQVDQSVVVSIHNLGNAPVSAEFVRYRLYLRDEDLAVETLLADLYLSLGLAAGEQHLLPPVIVTPTVDQVGHELVLRAEVDVGGVVTESREDDNELRHELLVEPPPQPDLTVSSSALIMDALQVHPGSHALGFFIGNQGEIAVTDGFLYRVLLYDLSTGGPATLLQEATINTDVAVGSSIGVVATNVDIDTAMIGKTLRLVVSVDPESDIDESNESNNALSNDFLVLGLAPAG